MRSAAVLLLSGIFAAGLVSASPGVAQVRAAPTQPATSTDLTLQIRRQKPDYYEWVTALTLGVPEAVTFRWGRPAGRADPSGSTSLRSGYSEKAQWQLIGAATPTTATMFLPSSQTGPSGLPLFALYSHASVPVAGAGSTANFTIPSTSIPAKPPGGVLWVRVVLSTSERLHASPWVKISMLGAQDPVEFTDLAPSYSEQDWDKDGMPDAQEYKLADQFKPLFVFDSDEGNRRPNEPVLIFQVRPKGCAGAKCTAAQIKYYLLFAKDGGYGPSSDCTDEHNGDNQPLLMNLASTDGKIWKPVSIKNGQFLWPMARAEFRPDETGRLTHPVVYLSAHKHHQYFNTASDGDGSPYSGFGCNDDVNGKGAQVNPSLLSPGLSSSGSRPNNVGEPEAHDPKHFIGDLGGLGFPGEHAWSSKPFKGGLGDDGGETSGFSWMDR